VLPGQQLRHRYALVNDSKTTWTIRQIHPACNCALGQISSQQVRPGETLTVEVSLRTPSQVGKTDGFIMAEFEEADAPFCILTFDGEVQSRLAVEPGSVYFGRIPLGGRPSQTVELINRGGCDVALQEVIAPDWVQAEYQPVEKPSTKDGRQAWKLTIRADASKIAPGAFLQQDIEVRTDVAELGSFFVPVSAMVQKLLDVTPTEINFGLVEKGKTEQRTLLIVLSPDLGEVKDKELDVTASGLPETLGVKVAREGPHRFKVVLQFQPKGDEGLLDGGVVVGLARDKMAPVRVRVNGFGK
jgi:hypothetical protein